MHQVKKCKRLWHTIYLIQHFIILCLGWGLLIKKEIKYKKRCEQKRAKYIEQIKDIDINNLIYLDETEIDNPDLNPIEDVWANLKRLLRKHPLREKNLSWVIKESIYNLFIG